MAKISNTSAYPNITPQASDYLVLTDTSDSNATKTVTVQALADFISVGNVTLQEVLDAGNTATEDINLTGNYTGTGNITLNGNYIGVGNINNQGNLTLTAGVGTFPQVDINGGAIDNTTIGLTAATRAIFASSGTSEAIRAVSFNTSAPALWIQTGGLQAKDVAGATSYGNDGDVLISKGSGGTTSDQVPRWTAQSEIEPHQVLKTVENQTGGVLVKGTPVKLDSNPSGTPRVIPADSGPVAQMPASGLVYEDIANGSEGKIILIGNLTNVSVTFSGTAPSVGDVVYVSETTGQLTVDRPTSETLLVQNVGIVSRTAGQTDIQVTCTGRSNDLPNLTAKDIFIGSSLAGEIGKAVETDLIQIDNTNPALPAYDITIGNPTAPTQTIVHGLFYANVVHPYGSNNLQYGEEALINPQGQNNTAIGLESLRNTTTGNSNTALGALSMTSNLSGSNNSALGNGALNNNTNGSDNTAIGFEALQSNVTGLLNTALGAEAGNSSTGNSNVFIGQRSGNSLTGNENVTIGVRALGSVTGAANNNVAIGHLAGESAAAAVLDNTIIGHDAGFSVQGNNNTILGSGAGRVSVQDNTIIGANAAPLASFASGTVTCVGTSALALLTSGRETVAVGSRSGDILVNGQRNTFLGERANCINAADSYVTAVGQGATGTDNCVALGAVTNASVPNAIALGAFAAAGNATININVSGVAGTPQGGIPIFPDRAAATGTLNNGDVYALTPGGPDNPGTSYVLAIF